MPKTYIKFLLVCTLLATVIFAGVNYTYKKVFIHNINDGIWYEEKVSKGSLLKDRDTPDYVFIGSSRTQNNINTYIFKERGIPAFNYGLAGRKWQEYPYIIKKSVAVAKIAVVISITPETLFQDIKCPARPVLYDLYFFIRELHRYDCFDNSDALKRILPINRLGKAFDMKKAISSTSDSITLINKRYGTQIETDPREINYIRTTINKQGEINRFLVTFRNGDGQVFTKRLQNAHIEREHFDLSEKEFNQNAINYLKNLSEIAAEESKGIILILEPSDIRTTTKINIQQLRRLLPKNIRLIDNSELYIKDNLWADYRHFNTRGNAIYTDLIYKQISSL